MPKIVQYGVHDVTYPRNARVRRALVERFGAEVVVVPRTRGESVTTRARADMGALWRASRGADAVMLAEMRVTHAPLVWAVGRLRRVPVVIDRFIGLHETAVEDWASVPARSLRARLFALQDALAERCGDVVVIDTALRAASLRTRRGVVAMDLPVGAPEWATWSAAPDSAAALRVLYYGNYIPLHGTELVVEALRRLAARRSFHATFVGGGPRRPHIEALVHAAGLDGHVTFLDPVPEAALADLIRDHHVVLGVFGASGKARSVVANKVWQGLACGRFVVTQQSPAVDELAGAAGPLLVQTPPGRATALADALGSIGAVPDGDDARGVTARLEAFVASRYDRFERELAALLHRTRR